MVPGVAAAVDDFAPDVLVVDQHALAGALVARQRRLPWATSTTTSAELTDPFTTAPKIAVWIQQLLASFQQGYGVSDIVDLRFSDHLVVAFTTAALVGPVCDFPGHYVFVGPAIGRRTGAPEFPWDWLRAEREHILVSLGTVNPEVGERFFAAASDLRGPTPPG
jgi:UDP:flavonoid glycosyltransferase YjiC (YdhE family)